MIFFFIIYFRVHCGAAKDSAKVEKRRKKTCVLFPEADQHSTDGWVRIIMPAKRGWAVVNTHILYYRWRGNSANVVYEKQLQEPDNKNY